MHFKKICRVCGTIIAQCRCPSLDKAVIKGICEKCRIQQNLCRDDLKQELSDG